MTSVNAVLKKANSYCILGAAPREAWKFLEVSGKARTEWYAIWKD